MENKEADALDKMALNWKQIYMVKSILATTVNWKLLEKQVEYIEQDINQGLVQRD